MRTLPLLRSLLLLAPLLMAACGPSTPREKIYAEGDGFDPLAFDRLEEDAAAAKKDEPRKISIPTNRQEDRGLRVDIALNMKEFVSAEARKATWEVAAGSPLYVTMTVRNTTMNAITVPYASEKRFDVVVFSDSEQRNPVFVYSDTQMFAQLFQEVVLSPGANLKRVIDVPTAKLDPYAKDAPRALTRALPPGDYWIYGTHEGTPNLAAGPLKIKVLE